MTDLEKLAELARAAEVDWDSAMESGVPTTEGWAYIAACSPDVILALIERATRAEADRDALRGLLVEVRKWMDVDAFGPWEAKFCARIDAALKEKDSSDD